MPSQNPLPRKKLPIGIQTFAKIREDDAYYYVDKTPLILQLIDQGSHYFLSRPRRFGKSLLLDTIAELFEGNRDLFTGLHAEQRWDWSRRFPVIRISFAAGVPRDRAALEQRILDILHQNSEHLGVVMPSELGFQGQFVELIRQAHDRHGQCPVVLIDEYDKPVIDKFCEPDIAREMCNALRDLYLVLKNEAEHIKFALLTGVSQFAARALFSDQSPFRDISLDPCYSAICGYTDSEIDTVFAPELPGLDREAMRDWFGGYQWNGVSVYNPAGAWSLFMHKELLPYWFEAGTPTFLSDWLKQASVFTPGLEGNTILAALQKTDARALLFQTGYLSLVSVTLKDGRVEYKLIYPNREARTSLQNLFLWNLTRNASSAARHKLKLYDLLQANDFTGLRALFTAFFASIPNDWYRSNPIANYEGYYASVFYSHFAALGLDIRCEDITHKGRIDMTVLFNGQVYLFEFKVVEDAPQGRALQQIKDRGYADKYRARGEPIHLIGVEFSREQRSVVGFEVESLPPQAS